MAQKVTAALMPPKVRDDEFFATEVEAIRSVINANADELDAVGKAASGFAGKAAAYIGQAAGRTLFQLGSALRDKTVLYLRRITSGGLGSLAPLPSGSAIDATTGVLSYPGTDEVLLVLVDGTLTVPLARTPEAGGLSLPTVDLLDLTEAQMLEVMALTYTDCDADPAASPAWSYPGQEFDAFYNGKNCRFYCTRGTFDPAAPSGTTGAGPAWHYTLKLG